MCKMLNVLTARRALYQRVRWGRDGGEGNASHNAATHMDTFSGLIIRKTCFSAVCPNSCRHNNIRVYMQVADCRTYTKSIMVFRLMFEFLVWQTH